MLRAINVDVIALREEFPQNILDVDLLAQLPERLGRDTVFVSGDPRITRRRLEARALRESKLTAIFLGPFWNNLLLWDQATWLVKHWPGIDKFVSTVTRGTCADIKQNGKAEPFAP